MSARVAGGKGYWHRFMAGEGVGANAVRDRHHGGVWQERRSEGGGFESQGGSRGAAGGTAGWRSHRGGCRTHHSMRILEGRGSRPRHGPAAAGPPQPGSGKGTGGRAPGGSSQQSRGGLVGIAEAMLLATNHTHHPHTRATKDDPGPLLGDWGEFFEVKKVIKGQGESEEVIRGEGGRGSSDGRGC